MTQGLATPLNPPNAVEKLIDCPKCGRPAGKCCGRWYSYQVQTHRERVEALQATDIPMPWLGRQILKAVAEGKKWDNHGILPNQEPVERQFSASQARRAPPSAA